MRQTEVTALKKLLLKQRANVLNQLNGNSLAEPVDRVEGADEVDVVVKEQSLAMSMHLHERERRLLLEIDHTLSKFELKSVGVCEGCQSQIQLKRLLARPIARYCVSCQEDQEEQRRNYA